MAATTVITAPTKKLLTEDLGKMFEMAICLAYGIAYDGPYKYGMEKPTKLAARLTKLPTLFPMCTHTAKKCSRYDYTTVGDATKHLSAKTTKRDGRVAPQVIGQPQPRKFCEILGIPFTTVPALKEYIQTNPTAILPTLITHTFDCPNIYYNDKTSKILFLTLVKPIDWSSYTYSWSCSAIDWKNSCRLKIITPGRPIPILEVQFHSKSRTNMAIRWFYEEFIHFFKDHFEITEL